MPTQESLWLQLTKNNLPQDREGYDGFEYTNEKLSARRIQWCGVKHYIFFFEELFLKIDENDLKIIYHAQLDAPR